jgi:hypothetical protein
MSDTQEKFYHGEATAYLKKLGINTHGVWRDLGRHDLTVVKEGKLNWTTQEALDKLAEIFLERRASDTKGQKLKDFAPDVSDEWKEICRQADIRLAEKMARLAEERKLRKEQQ